MSLEGASLTYQRQGGVRYELVPMGDDTFSFRHGDEYVGYRVRFARDDSGRVTHFVLMSVDLPRLESDPRAEF